MAMATSRSRENRQFLNIARIVLNDHRGIQVLGELLESIQ